MQISYRHFTVGLAAAVALGALLRVLSGISLVWCIAIGLAAIVINGIIATIEDRM